jgi:glycerol-3-phosphate dehydrogenase
MSHLPATRRRSLEGERFHVIVIGGGIHGAAIARECALAGRSTLLVEQNDFASGATSRCPRFLQDGLRYAQNGDSGLARQSLREQTQLLRERPHLVRPQEMLVAFSPSHPKSLKLRTNFWLYKQAGRKRPAQSGTLPHQEQLEQLMNPGWSVFQFEEAQCAFPERLVTEWILEAAETGGVVRNHTQALAIDVRQGRARGVLLRDLVSGVETQIEATWIVNATGTGVDRLFQRSRIKTRMPLATYIRRSHVVFPKISRLPDAAIHMEGKSGGALDLIPWNEQSILSGAEMVEPGDPAKAAPSQKEIDSMVESLRSYLPGVQISSENARYAMAEISAQPFSPNRRSTPDYAVYEHRDDGASNLLSVIGGGPVQAAAIASEIAEEVGAGKKRTGSVPEGSFQLNFDQWVNEIAAATGSRSDIAAAIAEWHGRRSSAVAELAQREASMRMPLCSHSEHIVAEAADAFANQFAVTLADVLLRRVPVALGPCWSAACSREAVTRIRVITGWNDQQAASELENFELDRADLLRKPVRTGVALPTAAD